MVQKPLEEKRGLRCSQDFTHLDPERMLCPGKPVDEVLHVHPAANAGTPQANAVALAVDDLAAPYAQEVHTRAPVVPPHRLACRSPPVLSVVFPGRARAITAVSVMPILPQS